MSILMIYSVPVAQPRQRHALIAGHLRNYVPMGHPVHVFKAACQLAWHTQCPDEQPLDGPVCIRCLFVLPKPASRLRKRTAASRVLCDTKPDIDNLVKSLLDALAGLAWTNDSRICKLECSKVFGGDEQPHVEVEILDWSNHE